MSGNEIREQAKRNGVFLWQVARAAKISVPTLTRWLREDLSPERAELLQTAIRSEAMKKPA